MKVLILEACRSPEVNKGLTEPLALSQLFDDGDIEYELYSNDGIWTNSVQIDEVLIRSRLKESAIDVVHFAVHGEAKGLILKWSNEAYIGDRIPLNFLTALQINQTPDLLQERGKSRFL